MTDARSDAAAFVSELKGSLASSPTIRSAVVASNPFAGSLAGTVGVYLDGDTSTIVPATGGPLLAVGDVVAVWVGTTIVCLPVAGSAPFAVATGTVSVSVSSGVGSATVTYPSGRFTQAPKVLCTPEGGTPFSAYPSAYNGTTGFTLALTQLGSVAERTYSGTRNATWLAVQMTSAAAAG